MTELARHHVERPVVATDVPPPDPLVVSENEDPRLVRRELKRLERERFLGILRDEDRPRYNNFFLPLRGVIANDLAPTAVGYLDGEEG